MTVQKQKLPPRERFMSRQKFDRALNGKKIVGVFEKPDYSTNRFAYNERELDADFVYRLAEYVNFESGAAFHGAIDKLEKIVNVALNEIHVAHDEDARFLSYFKNVEAAYEFFDLGQISKIEVREV
jgi:hypothetical protein